MKILIFKGSSRYDVLSTYSLIATTELRKLGANAVTVEMNLMNSNDYLRLIEKFKPDLTLGFNPVTYFYEDEKNHIMKTGIPHVLRIGDHPFYHLNNRAMLNPNHPKLLTLSTEKFFEQAFETNKVTRYKRITTLPGLNVSKQVKFNDKTIPLCYFGTYHSVDQIILDMQNQFKENPIILKVLMDFCGDLNYLLINNKKYIQNPIELLLEQYIRDSLKLDGESIDKVVKLAFVHVDLFHRNLTRKLALIEIAESGVEMYTFSAPELQNVLGHYPNVRFFNPVSYLESLHIISQSKANINITPMFTSLHERIPNSFLNNSILFSNKMVDFMESNKELSEGSVFFDQDTISDSVNHLNSIINNENIFNDLTEQNYILAQKKFTFKQELTMLEQCLKNDF
ncbi:hypothetical protein [Sporosarcina sp. FSL K6-1508]|uniref:hypothetical protein n=1 Tax=Sporosarcina sp. FSL K6-1508 TaxID=2921553 RepID=UPI0030FA5A3B